MICMLLEICHSYNNPCVDLLKALCHGKLHPNRCPPVILIFFRSIRKYIIPAISIAPKRLWNSLRLYLSNHDLIDKLVTTLFIYLLICIKYKESQQFSPVLESILGLILKERDNQIRKAANRIIEASLDIAKELLRLGFS